MKIKLFLFLFFFSPLFSLFGQQTILKGKISDAESKEGLPSCNIYINNTTIGTNTDLEGNFGISYFAEGEFELVVTYVGYVSQRIKIKPNPKEVVNLSISLVPSNFQLTEVQVKAKRDKRWEKQLKRFQVSFFGESEFAENCEILNPWVIDFEEDNDGLKAKADQPIKINNTSLGYNLNFDLNSFFVSKNAYKISATVQFLEKEPNSKTEMKRWLENRAIAYKKSQMYFFKSLIDNKLTENGFLVFEDKPGSVPNAIRSNLFRLEIGKSVIEKKAVELFDVDSKLDLKRILINNTLEIHNEKLESPLKTYADTPYAVSWMQANSGEVIVNKNGMPINQADVYVSGDMNFLKVSGMLPLNYNPNATENEAYFLKFEKPKFTEHVHLHTDRLAYYPGDDIWFKAFLNYKLKGIKDTTSSILHVQLVDSNKNIIDKKRIEITNGYAYGEFNLPENLSRGQYQLRAFTQYMLNFDSQFLFQQPISILSKTEIFKQSKLVDKSSEKVNISTSTETLEHNSVKLNIKIKNELGEPLPANISLSVNNPKFAPSFMEEKSIEQNLLYKTQIPESRNEIRYAIEKGITINGIFLDKKNLPVEGDLNVFVGNLQNLYETKANSSGNFFLKDLFFYDNTNIYFQPKSKKNKENLFIVKNNEPSPTVNFEAKWPNSEIENIDFLKIEKITKSNNESLKDSLKKESNETKSLLYGIPDYVLKEKDITKNANAQGILNGLRSKVPSISITSSLVTIRGGAISKTNTLEPLILLNGTIVSSRNSSVIAILSTVDPNSIERIEVVTRIVNMYGELGRNGIISIFTKNDANKNEDSDLKNFNKVEVVGIIEPKEFSVKNSLLINENEPTMYWNPEILTDSKGEASVEFVRKDFKNKIKIEIQGISSTNVPFRSVLYLD